jgi:hypothetical protein
VDDRRYEEIDVHSAGVDETQYCAPRRMDCGAWAARTSARSAAPDPIRLRSECLESGRLTAGLRNGAFRDEELLRAKGLEPDERKPASVDGLRLLIGQRATLVPDSGGRVHGFVFSLRLFALEHLYLEPSVRQWQPAVVLARWLPEFQHLAPGPPGLGDRRALLRSGA